MINIRTCEIQTDNRIINFNEISDELISKLEDKENCHFHLNDETIEGIKFRIVFTYFGRILTEVKLFIKNSENSEIENLKLYNSLLDKWLLDYLYESHYEDRQYVFPDCIVNSYYDDRVCKSFISLSRNKYHKDKVKNHII